MNARELERLLGGYAAGTLTDSEHSALMRAALDDQQLFDALADEEALRDALADPVFRTRLRARLAPDAPPARGLRWMWWLAPALAAGLALLFVINRPESPKTMEMASAKLPAQEAAAPPQTPAPAPEPASTAQARKAAPALSGRADREVSTRANEAAPKELREELPPPAAAPPPPPPPKQAPPTAVAESVSLSAPVASAEKKSVKDERAKASADAEAPARLAAGGAGAGARPAAPPAAAPSPAVASRAAASDPAVAPNPAAAVELELQIERTVNGRFESAELGALRQGDRVRFRVRPPEDGNLTFAAGSRTTTTAARRGQTYYLPSAEGLPPGDAPLEVAIALQPAATVEPATLFRSRQQATNAPAGSSAGAMRDAAKEQDALAPQKAVAAPRVLRLRLEFK